MEYSHGRHLGRDWIERERKRNGRVWLFDTILDKDMYYSKEEVEELIKIYTGREENV